MPIESQFIENLVDDVLSKVEEFWSDWQPMPNPENCRQIQGPNGSGIYQIKNNATNELVLFGIGEQCQKRMKSLFPPPYGTGTRNNKAKRKYVLENWENLAYRTIQADDIEAAKSVEYLLIARNNHLFNT